MKAFLMIAFLGFATSTVWAQSAEKSSSEETKAEPAKKSEDPESRHEKKKSAMRRFGEAQRDFWKTEHEKRVAEKEAKEKGETVKKSGPPKPPSPFKKKKKEKEAAEEDE
ncbi:hypothetical protein [Niabella digestorum]|jgi:hypothetical protein|uniref:Uncharacterized protein n=1 Tax=Niabella digestorum TaxID=3117701 RepID=A0ABU7RHA2_9BACT